MGRGVKHRENIPRECQDAYDWRLPKKIIAESRIGQERRMGDDDDGAWDGTQSVDEVEEAATMAGQQSDGRKGKGEK